MVIPLIRASWADPPNPPQSPSAGLRTAERPRQAHGDGSWWSSRPRAPTIPESSGYRSRFPTDAWRKNAGMRGKWRVLSNLPCHCTANTQRLPQWIEPSRLGPFPRKTSTIPARESFSKRLWEFRRFVKPKNQRIQPAPQSRSTRHPRSAKYRATTGNKSISSASSAVRNPARATSR